MSTSQREATP